MEYTPPRLHLNLQKKFRFPDLLNVFHLVLKKILSFLQFIRQIGISETLDDYEIRKLGIFNQLNFFQLITGTVIPITALLPHQKFAGAWLVASFPALVSAAVLFLNFYRKYQAALLVYFILYPVLTCFIYINGMNLGVELSFILYGILSVFFLEDIGYMLFTISLSMVSYFVLAGAWKTYPFELKSANVLAFVINELVLIIYIFYGLFLIKKENAQYQIGILTANRQLHKKNIEIGNQKKEIAQKAKLLQKQTEKLEESNTIKNKLFSVISHDLKTPMYALRNLFQNAREMNISGREIKKLLPDVINDLNYTTGLMENLLQWAKCQMQASLTRPYKLDVSKLVDENVRLLHLQAQAKKILVETKNDLPAHAYADREMVNLVLRNLLSNAIKFTPENGKVIVGTYESQNCVEVFVQDSGEGITKENMEKINQNNFYTTNGTNSESGTGLGLMLCREFLVKNGGRLMIESEPGKGSTFSFTLPLA